MNLHEPGRWWRAVHAAMAMLGLGLIGLGAGVMVGSIHTLETARVQRPAVLPTPGKGRDPALAMVEPVPPAAREPASPAAESTGERRVYRLQRRARPGVTPPAPPATEAPEPRAGRPGETGPPRLAVVIDDIGHNLWAPRAFLALERPLTFSILPGVPHAREAARLVRSSGREFIVHLPMEPVDYPVQDPGPEPLLLSQGAEETRRRVARHLASLPGAIGASNHMGSAYTRNPQRMMVVQRELARRGLFFLNSLTIDTPIPGEIARNRGYRYLERDVFLDHTISEAAIARAFESAVARSKRQGAAIAIGHPHRATLRVLRRLLPRAAEGGVRLVSLSTLAGRDTSRHAGAGGDDGGEAVARR